MSSLVIVQTADSPSRRATVIDGRRGDAIELTIELDCIGFISQMEI